MHPGSSKGKHKRERDWECERDVRRRDTREHERELYNWGVPGVPLSMPDTEWDAVNGLPVQTPTPPPAPREPPERVFCTKQSVSLGSYVYPVTPFPYAFLAELADVPAATTGKLLKDKTTGTSTLNLLATATKDKPDVTSDIPATSEPEDPELLALKTHTTLLFPTAHLPLGRLKPVHLWGGGVRVLVSSSSVLSLPLHDGGGRHLCHPSQVATLLLWHSHTSLPHSHQCREVVGEPQQQRQIYTDDSDPLSVAVHTGFVRWSTLRRVRREGRDARVEVRVVRVLGAASKGELGKEPVEFRRCGIIPFLS
jgi:hypothetical protein